MEHQYHADFLVIGSGFGGSVSALRLREKGYSVTIAEQGRRFTPHTLPKNTWQLKQWLWLPWLGLRGFFAMRLFKHMLVLHGNAVGGGSITYANTLLIPQDKVWQGGSWHALCDWAREMPEHYRTAEKMLGVTVNARPDAADERLRIVGERYGVGESYYLTRVGVYFGDGDEHAHVRINGDPYFGGEGPSRQPCNACGGCMVGCRFRAKNSLDYNYLYFAEKKGAKLLDQTRVVRIVPLGNADGSAGYRVTLKSAEGLKKITVRGIVLAASSLGSQELLLRMKADGHLPRISERVGTEVYTNAESLIGVRFPDEEIDLSRGIAIGSGLYLNENTHIEATRYPAGSDTMGLLSTLMHLSQDGRVRVSAWLGYFLKKIVTEPKRTFALLRLKDFARKGMIFLCMQPVNHTLTMRLKRAWYFPFYRRLVSTGQRIPARIDEANAFAQYTAQEMNGTAYSALTDMLLNIPVTAHCMGGVPMGENPEQGAVDGEHRLFGYQNFYVCDGSVVSANLGVNPSLTITALTERAMSKIPARSEWDWA